MPNWCHTSLIITGPAEDIKRFHDGIHLNDKGEYEIVSSYFPTPDELDITEGFGPSVDLLQEQYAANIAKYGHRSWYDWRLEHYGSKWPDCDTYLNHSSDTTLSFSLNSAWSPLGPAFRHISTLFPTLGFVLSYDEEAGFYVGAEAYKNGETLFFEQEDPEFRDQGEDENEDDYWEAQSQHRCDILDRLHDAAECALAEHESKEG